jgi:immune inhibitor A
VHFPWRPGVRTFNDASSYWSASAPYAGVKVPNTGTRIRVTDERASRGVMRVDVNP